MHTKTYFEETARIAKSIDLDTIECLANELAKLRDCNGRLFFIGVGGSDTAAAARREGAACRSGAAPCLAPVCTEASCHG